MKPLQVPLLKTTGLIAHYGDFQALFGVDIELDVAETVAIIGANGAGKTTLLSILGGMLRPTEGRVHLGSVELTALGPP